MTHILADFGGVLVLQRTGRFGGALLVSMGLTNGRRRIVRNAALGERTRPGC